MYSVFSSRPVKVRVMSTRPWTSVEKRVELIASACDQGAMSAIEIDGRRGRKGANLYLIGRIYKGIEELLLHLVELVEGEIGGCLVRSCVRHPLHPLMCWCECWRRRMVCISWLMYIIQAIW